MSGNRGKLDDKELIGRILENNDQLAYAALMKKYKNAINFTILKMVHNQDDADDLTMQTFAKAFDSLGKYDNSFAFTTWIFKIASNCSIDFIRKKRLVTTSLDKETYEDMDGEGSSTSIVSNMADDSLDPEEEMLRNQRNKILQEVIDSMDKKYSELIKMYYFDDLKYEEISEKLSLPLGTVKVRLRRGKEFINQLLRGGNHDIFKN